MVAQKKSAEVQQNEASVFISGRNTSVFGIYWVWGSSSSVLHRCKKTGEVKIKLIDVCLFVLNCWENKICFKAAIQHYQIYSPIESAAKYHFYKYSLPK